MRSKSVLALYTSPGVDISLDDIGVQGVAHWELADDETPPHDSPPGVWVAAGSDFGSDADSISTRLQRIQLPDDLALALVAELEQTLLSAAADEQVFAFINPHAPSHLQAKIIRSALTTMRLSHQQRDLTDGLQRRDQQLRELNEIGVALSAQHDVDALLELILFKAREITRADAGSLYLVETAEDGTKLLRFKLTQNDSFEMPWAEFTMPITKKALSGYSAATGEVLRVADVYHLPDDVEYEFNIEFDKRTGYRTKSMLVVAMKNNQGEIRGVLQLINRKPSRKIKLDDAESFEEHVIEFADEDQELVESLASQAAVALENQLLVKSIESIFEGFLSGWVKAVEDRDPATAGHSHRVTALTMALAREVNKVTEGPYADYYLDEVKMRELRYAGLLHDLGKIYVRPEVFLKANRLYPHDLRTIEGRFSFAHRTIENDFNTRRLERMIEEPNVDHTEEFGRMEAECRTKIEALDHYLETIEAINQAPFVDADRKHELEDIARNTFHDLTGEEAPLLSDDELGFLQIERGTLTEEERKEIESHVVHSERILARIPWTAELRDIPAIAGAHHEKLDGSGYHKGLTSDQIPVQSKMMTIADIYDALTAADRPYKKAMPIERALQILGFERDDGHIDADLLALFEERKVYEMAHRDLQDVIAAIDRMVYEDAL